MKDKLAAATSAAEDAKKNDPEKESLTGELNRVKGLYDTSQTNLKKYMNGLAKAKKQVTIHTCIHTTIATICAHIMSNHMYIHVYRLRS